MLKTAAADRMAALPDDKREELLSKAAQWRVLHQAGSKEFSELREEDQQAVTYLDSCNGGRNGGRPAAAAMCVCACVRARVCVCMSAGLCAQASTQASTAARTTRASKMHPRCSRRRS